MRRADEVVRLRRPGEGGWGGVAGRWRAAALTAAADLFPYLARGVRTCLRRVCDVSVSCVWELSAVT